MDKRMHCYSAVPDSTLDASTYAKAVDALETLLPGLKVVEAPFAVPGAGEAAGVALDPDGRCTLIEVSRGIVRTHDESASRRLDWFTENLTLFPRLFAGQACAPMTPQTVVIAPDFADAFLRVTERVDTLHPVRLRTLRSTTGDALLIEPVGETASAAAWVQPGLAAEREANATVDVTADTTPIERPDDKRIDDGAPAATDAIAAQRPARTSPNALLHRAIVWLEKLSPDIGTQSADGRTTVVSYSNQPLATFRVGSDCLHIEVPSVGRLQARDDHALNRAIQHVIARFFKLVEPRASVTRALRREDILTDRELAELT